MPKRSLRQHKPSMFWTHLIMKGYEHAMNEGIVGTDDSSLVERIGHDIKMIRGSYDNIKITTPEDLIIAESLLKDMDGLLSRKIFYKSR